MPAGTFAGGGPSFTYQSLSLPQLNAMLATASLPPAPGAVWLVGGGGFGPIPGTDGRLTVGGFGAGALYEAVGGSKRLRFAMGYGGVRLGWRRPLSGPLSLDAGLGMTFGGATVTVLHTTPASFPAGLGNASETSFSRFVLGLVPDVNLIITLAPRLHLQLGVGYFVDTGLFGNWNDAAGNPVPQAPGDSIGGLQYRVTVLFGPAEPRPGQLRGAGSSL